jgi:predicted ATPase
MQPKTQSTEIPLKSLDSQLPEQRLTQIRFESFKAFEQQTQVDLNPITLVAGVNSGGKTSILQSLLIARQTLITPYRQTVEDALKYDSELFGFTSFNELIFGNPHPNNKGGIIQLGFAIQIKPQLSADSSFPKLEEYFSHSSLEIEKLVNVQLNVQFKYDNKQKIVVASQIEMQAHCLHGQQNKGSSLILEPKGDTWHLTQLKVGEISQINENKWINPIEHRLSVDRFIPVLKGLPVWTSDMQKPERLFYGMFMSIFAPALALLREELEKRLFYVGPLRSAPQRYYLHQRVVGLDVGPSGEMAVQLLYENWEKFVDFVSILNLEEFIPTQVQLKQMSLKDAVQKTLKLLGMEQALKINKQGKNYEALLSLLSEPQTYTSIVEVGFGVSQILPIIAVSLLSPVNSILIFEQPEIHLHPRAQAGLAEFFLCLTLTGRRILVETHSDHLINRLRRRIAEDESNYFEKGINILFVHPPENGQGAIAEKGQINKYGQIENWPPSFLAESAFDARAILLAASNKRIIEREQGNVT